MLIQETSGVYGSYQDAADVAGSLYGHCIALASFLLQAQMPENGGYQFTSAPALSRLWRSNGDGGLVSAVERNLLTAFEKDLGVNPVDQIFVLEEGKSINGGILTAYVIWPIKRKDCYLVGALATTRLYWQTTNDVSNKALWAVKGNIESFLRIGAFDRNHSSRYADPYPAVGIKDRIDLAEPAHFLDFGKVYAGLINKQR